MGERDRSACWHVAAGGVILSHAGAGVFVKQAGQALFQAELLQRFVTTIIDRPNSWWRRCGVPNAWLDEQLCRRAVTGFPDALAVGHPGRELLRLLAQRVDRSGVLADVVWEWAELGFDQWVADHGLDGAGAVYAYEHAALSTFLAAKERGIACVYDVPAPEHEFAQRVRDDEIRAHPQLDNAYQRRTRRCRARRTARRRREWAAADMIFVGSDFTKSTYSAAGLSVDKVRVIAPGAPPVHAEAPERLNAHPTHAARFLFVGAVAVHKGVHHLLAAWRLLNVPAGLATLEIVGDVSLPGAVLRDCPDSVHFSGRLRSEKVLEHYRRADALVFPTLCDGFGMVVTEAFSQGLPVITTERAGAAELVRPGINGFVVAAGDPEALASSLDWCLTHRADLQAMRAEARATAAGWQWSDYRRRLAEEIKLGLLGKGHPA